MPGIVVGVDGSAHSQRALEWALQEAVARQAPLTVISVHPALMSVAHAVTLPEGTVSGDDARSRVQAAVDESLAALTGPRPQVTVRVTPGSPSVELINAAQDAELLVLGTRGTGGFARLMLGSVSAQVLHHAPCPVVVIPAAGDR